MERSKLPVKNFDAHEIYLTITYKHLRFYPVDIELTRRRNENPGIGVRHSNNSALITT